MISLDKAKVSYNYGQHISPCRRLAAYSALYGVMVVATQNGMHRCGIDVISGIKLIDCKSVVKFNRKQQNAMVQREVVLEGVPVYDITISLDGKYIGVISKNSVFTYKMAELAAVRRST